MILVTGATGHLGNVLVKRLVAEGHEVGILVHNKPPLEVFGNLPLTIFQGDVTDPASLVEPCKQAELVYHLAAKISISSGEYAALHKINVEGARTVARTCLEQGVKKLIYASSVHALAESPKGSYTIEKVPDTTDRVLGDYAKSKVLAFHEVMKVAAEGLNVVTVFPSGIIGPFDYKPSQIGITIKNYLAGKPSAFFKGQYNFVDVRDVVAGMLAAAEKGRPGEGYILGGAISSTEQIFQILEKHTGLKPQINEIPVWLAYGLSYLAEFMSKLKKEEPIFTPYSVTVLQSNPLFSSDKAINELGFSHRPIEQTLIDAANWHSNNKEVINNSQFLL